MKSKPQIINNEREKVILGGIPFYFWLQIFPLWHISSSHLQNTKGGNSEMASGKGKREQAASTVLFRLKIRHSL